MRLPRLRRNRPAAGGMASRAIDCGGRRGRQPPRWACAAALVAALACVSGCQMAAPSPAPTALNMDPCAERLHELCGHFLLYYAAHKEMPPNLNDLAASSGLSSAALVCPDSGKPYVYDADGLTIPERQGRLVLYDAEPMPSGSRWGILVTGRPGTLMTANVVLISAKELAAATKAPVPTTQPE